MAKPAIGAIVRYCGHKGTFVADIWKVGNVNIVHAAGPVNPATIDRDEHTYANATHQITDMPLAGFWRPFEAMFVLPLNQVTELKKTKARKKVEITAA